MAERTVSSMRVTQKIEMHTHSSIVVQVNFNVTLDDTAKSADKFVDLTRVRAADGVGNTHAVHTNLVHSLVD
jgi:hypothetical protein